MAKYGPIEVFQDGKPVTELIAKAAQCADHTGWRPLYIENLTIVLSVERSYQIQHRFFADIKCVTRFAEYGHEFKHNAPCDMAPGTSEGSAVVDIYSLPMNFKEFHNTELEIEFNLGAGAEASLTIPVKIPQTVAI